MGDISELRGIIVVGTFLSVFALLCGLIPSQFVYPSVSGKSVTVPSEVGDIVLYNSTTLQVNFTAFHTEYPSTYGVWGEDLVFGSVYYRLQALQINNSWSYPSCVISYYMPNYPYGYGMQAMDWRIEDTGYADIYNGEVLLYLSTLDSLGVGKTSVTFTVVSIVEATHQYTLSFFWDNATYSLPSDALEADNMYVRLGQSIDQTQTTMSAWNMIWAILIFQIPIGVPLMIGMLIAIPIWICEAYLIVIFILKIINALKPFGGGGA